MLYLLNIHDLILLSIIAAFDVVTACAFRYRWLRFFVITRLFIGLSISAIVVVWSLRRRDKDPVN